jgi:hypothetical protein
MLLAPTYFKCIYICTYVYMLSIATSSLYPDWPPVSAKNRAALVKPHTLTYTELKPYHSANQICERKEESCSQLKPATALTKPTNSYTELKPYHSAN